MFNFVFETGCLIAPIVIGEESPDNAEYRTSQKEEFRAQIRSIESAAENKHPRLGWG